MEIDYIQVSDENKSTCDKFKVKYLIHILMSIVVIIASIFIWLAYTFSQCSIGSKSDIGSIQVIPSKFDISNVRIFVDKQIFVNVKFNGVLENVDNITMIMSKFVYQESWYSFNDNGELSRFNGSLIRMRYFGDNNYIINITESIFNYVVNGVRIMSYKIGYNGLQFDIGCSINTQTLYIEKDCMNLFNTNGFDGAYIVNNTYFNDDVKMIIDMIQDSLSVKILQSPNFLNCENMRLPYYTFVSLSLSVVLYMNKLIIIIFNKFYI